MNNKYNHKEIESYVQNFWESNNTFKTDLKKSKEKYYCLSMFPYTSGKIHIGHIRNYTIGDIISRFYRMNGKNVFYPIGWDSFGLPAENSALLNNESPKEWTYKNIFLMKKQLKLLGFSFDWSKEILTLSPKYYKYEQYFLKELYKKKLLYKKYYPVNWCKYDNTVLSNEQVIDKKCWRCNSKISIINKKQWFIKITKYADALFYKLDKLIYWPNKVILMQKNWINRLEWIEIKFKILNFINYKYIYIYLYDICDFLKSDFVVISLNNIIAKEYLKFNKLFYHNKNKSLDNNGLLDTNIYIENIYIKKKIYIKISNNEYIFKNIFINKRNINYNEFNTLNIYKKILYNYAFHISTNNNVSIKVENIYKNIFSKKIIYNLKDWCISRQRYWGVPIPIAKYIKNNKTIIVPNKYLPIHPPSYYNYLNKNINNIILINKKIAIKEKDTLDTFIQSSWYYIKFLIKEKNKKININKKIINNWLPIDQYIGGIEHSTMHLLYIRFFNKLIKDYGFIKHDEPIKKLLCQGMILSETYFYINNNKKIWVNKKDLIKKEDINKKNCFYFKNIKVNYGGLNKMSKSKNNGIDPIDIIDKYGADTLRMFIIFSAPSINDFIWDDKNIIGIYRFLNKLWNLVNNYIDNIYINNLNKIEIIEDNLLKYINNIITNITDDIINKQLFNKSISLIMKLTNKIKYLISIKYYSNKLLMEFLSIILKLIYPFAPHISFILWKKLGYKNCIDYESWPKIYIINHIENKINIIFQINDKFKENIYLKNELNKIELLNLIKEKLKKFNIKNNYKFIYIKNKIINVLINKNNV